VLRLASDVTKAWAAWCSSGLEYLSLPEGNYSGYAAGGYAGGTDMRTTYSKVRILPAIPAIDVGDMTFATTTGALTLTGSDPGPVGPLPFGFAGSCSGLIGGQGEVVMTGTGFAIAPSEFVLAGYQPFGMAAGTSEAITLSGGGKCGDIGPAGLADSTEDALLPIQVAQ
jgi:hypothetical protein